MLQFYKNPFIWRTMDFKGSDGRLASAQLEEKGD